MSEDVRLRIPLPPAGSGEWVTINGLTNITEANWDFVMSVLEVMKPGCLRPKVSLTKRTA
jgi:hypothetical protein